MNKYVETLAVELELKDFCIVFTTFNAVVNQILIIC
jgi:hypothetical protein